LLDEATSALDPDTEVKVYDLLFRSLPKTAWLSIAARPWVLRDFPKRWTLEHRGEGRVTLHAA
jgi:ABC-type uncharacterized transport system fused permease/ATPase subunit